MASKEILVNLLFAGRYLSEEGNIGHEIINLFEDDEGVRYLYITPSGEVKGHDVESVVFVRNVKAHKTVEVIAVATGLSAANDDAEKVKYNGIPIGRVFRGNTYHGGEDPFTINITYKADKVLVPKGDRRILISIDPSFDLSNYQGSILLDSTHKVVIPQGMRMYYSADSDETAFQQLRGLISDMSLWEPAPTGQLVADKAAGSVEPSYLEIIGKQDDEIVFSNLFKHYFDYSHTAFVRFAEEVLNVPDMESDFIIVRESNYNIDLWIESEKHILVIENKLKSGINGLDDNGGSQLDKYHQKAEEYAKEHGKSVHYFVFAPDYSSIDLSKYDSDSIWAVVPYSRIYDFFANHVTAYVHERFFFDFLIGLERHASTMSDLNYKTMKARFLRKIAQSK